MATYKYNGEVGLEIPSLTLALKPGDTFEAPDGLNIDKISPVGKTTKSASSDTTVGA